MRTRKCVVFLLVMVLLVSMLAGCSKKEEKQTSNNTKVEDNKTASQNSDNDTKKPDGQDADSQDGTGSDADQSGDSGQIEGSGSDVLTELMLPLTKEKKEISVMIDTGTLACIYGINSSNDGVYAPKEWYGLTVREDMLPDIGVTELPETIEEWHTMLVAAKEHNIEAPLLTRKNGYISTAAFMTAYGILPEFYQENGVVKYGPLEEGYREWVSADGIYRR